MPANMISSRSWSSRCARCCVAGNMLPIWNCSPRRRKGSFRQFLKLEKGVPSHDTFSRVFRLLDPEQFRACFQKFMGRFSQACQGNASLGVIAIDGKVLRRSFDKASGKSPLHMVSAWGCEQRLVLAQIATDAKSNEITAVPQLLKLLSLKGAIVTVDALNCERAIAQQIIDQGGDYAFALKGKTTSVGLDHLNALTKPTTQHTTVDADHGRIETRAVSSDIDWLQERHGWPGLQAIGTASEHFKRPTAYYLFSTPIRPNAFETGNVGFPCGFSIFSGRASRRIEGLAACFEDLKRYLRITHPLINSSAPASKVHGSSQACQGNASLGVIAMRCLNNHKINSARDRPANHRSGMIMAASNACRFDFDRHRLAAGTAWMAGLASDRKSRAQGVRLQPAAV